MSFGCPHYGWDREQCMRTDKDCVPGRPGCVLRENSVFAVPVGERLRKRDEESQSDTPASEG